MAQKPRDDADSKALVNRRSVLQAKNSKKNQKRHSKNKSNRRRFLTAAAGAVATVGFTGVAAGLTSPEQVEKNEARRQYASEAKARRTIQDQSAEALDLLVERGLISNSDIDDIMKKSVDVSGLYAGEKPTAHLHIGTEIDAGHLSIVVQPQAGNQYALVRPKGNKSDEIMSFDSDESEQTLILDPDLEGPAPRCPSTTGCLGAQCGCEEYWVNCCRGDCYTGGKTGKSCCLCKNPNCHCFCSGC